MSVRIEDKTSVAATYNPETLATTPIEGGVVEVLLNEYLEVLPNPETDGVTRFGVYGYNKNSGGKVAGRRLEAGETRKLTDGITAIGTD